MSNQPDEITVENDRGPADHLVIMQRDEAAIDRALELLAEFGYIRTRGGES